MQGLASSRDFVRDSRPGTRPGMRNRWGRQTSGDARPHGGLECEHSPMPAEARRATKFLLAALAWSLGLFALLRTPWVEERLVSPLTQLQKQAADYYAGSPAAPMVVTTECSGTDVLAL